MSERVKQVDLAEARRMTACLIFADNESGIPETQALMRDMVNEIASLRAQLTAATKRAEVWEAEARAWREYGLAESEGRVNDASRAWGKAQGAMMRTDALTAKAEKK